MTATALIVLLAACAAPPDVSRHSPRAAGPDVDASVIADAAALEPAITAPPSAPDVDPVPGTRVIAAHVPDRADPGVVRTVGARTVVGDGTRGSCTASALARAVSRGGTVTFACGGEARIVLPHPLELCATVGCEPDGAPVRTLRLDGGDRTTLVGAGAARLIEARGCAASTGGCGPRPEPHVVLSRIGLEGGVAPDDPDDALGYGGGAVAMVGGRLTLDRVTLAGNSCAGAAGSAGGAVLARDMAAVTVRGTTVMGNSCGHGGGLAVVDAPLSVTGVTVVDNAAEVAGGGLLVVGGERPAEIAMTLMAGNTAPVGPAIDRAGAEVAIRDSRIEPGADGDDAIAVRALAD